MESHFESLYPKDTRFEQIERVLSYIKEGNSVQLVSIPGVGRSNLFGLLSYNTKVRTNHLGINQKNYHFVNINLSEVKNKANSDVFKFIFLELLDSLKERKIEQDYVSKILKESIYMNDEMVIFQGLKKTIEYLTLEKNLTIILLFDRFEIFTQTATSDFFSNLRILRNRAKYHFSSVFSLNKPLEEIFEKELLVDFYEFIADHIVYLPIYDKPGVDFRVSYLEKSTGKKIPKEKLEEILKLTGGHGKLTRICLEVYLAISDKQQEISKSLRSDDLKSKFLGLQKTVQGVLLEITSSLSPSDLKDLRERNSNIYLEKVELLKNSQITMPLLEEFLKNYEVEKKNIIFDQDTNKITKGELVLSDNLTSSEFKLLKFLIENKNKILEREEIISTVWKDTKTTQGVTDQALDQLISRLRKKIEDDPNSPSHLLTVKGRGLKFV